MTQDAPAGLKPLFVTVGDNPARAFGMAAGDRARALALQAGLEPAENAQPGRSAIYADLGWAWDPAWLGSLAGHPGQLLVKDGHPVLAHVPAGGDPAAVLGAMRSGDRYQGDDLVHPPPQLLIGDLDVNDVHRHARLLPDGNRLLDGVEHADTLGANV